MICNQIISNNICLEITGSFTDKRDLTVINCFTDNVFCQQADCFSDEISTLPIPTSNEIWIQTHFTDFKNNKTIKFCSNYLKLENTSNQFVRYKHQNQYFFDDDITIDLWFRLRTLNPNKTYILTKRRKTDFGGLEQPHGNRPDIQVYVDNLGRLNIEWTNSIVPLEKIHFKCNYFISPNQIYNVVIKKPQNGYRIGDIQVIINNNVDAKISVFENLTPSQYKLFENLDGTGTSRRWNTVTRLPSLIPTDPVIINDGDWILGAYLECNNLPSTTALGTQLTSNIDLFGFNIYKRLLTNQEISDNWDIGTLQCPSKINIYTDNILTSTFNQTSGNFALDNSFYNNHGELILYNTININSNTYTDCDCPCGTSLSFGFTNNELNVSKTSWASYDEGSNCCNELNCYQIEAVEQICELEDNIAQLIFTFTDNTNWFSNAEINGYKDKGLYISFDGNCSLFTYDTIPSDLKFGNYLNFSDFIDGVVLYYQTLTASWGSTTVTRSGDSIILDIDINYYRLTFGQEICDLKPKICQVQPNTGCTGSVEFYINIITTSYYLYQIKVGDCYTINIPPPPAKCVYDNATLYTYLTGGGVGACVFVPPPGMIVTLLADGSVKVQMDLQIECCGAEVILTGQVVSEDEQLEYIASEVYCCVNTSCNQTPNYKIFTFYLDPLGTYYFNDPVLNGCITITPDNCPSQFPCNPISVCTKDYADYQNFMLGICTYLQSFYSAYTFFDVFTGEITAYLPSEFCDLELNVCKSGCFDETECPGCSKCTMNFRITLLATPYNTNCNFTVSNSCISRRGGFLLNVNFISDPNPAVSLLNLYNALVAAYPTYTFTLPGVGNYDIDVSMPCYPTCTCVNIGTYTFRACYGIDAYITDQGCTGIAYSCPCRTEIEISFNNFNISEIGSLQTFNIDIFCGFWITKMTVNVTIQATLYDTLIVIRDALALAYPLPNASFTVINPNKLRIFSDCNTFLCTTTPDPNLAHFRMTYGGDMILTTVDLDHYTDLDCLGLPQILDFQLINSTPCCEVDTSDVTLIDQNDMLITQPILNPRCCPQQLGVAGLQTCCCEPLDDVYKLDITCQNNLRTNDPNIPFAQNIWFDLTNLPTSIDKFSIKVISNNGREFNSFCFERPDCRNVISICAEFKGGIDVAGKYRCIPEQWCGCPDKFDNQCIEIFGEFGLEKTEYSFDDNFGNITKTFYRLVTPPLSSNLFNEIFSYLSQETVIIDGIEMEIDQSLLTEIQGRKDNYIDIILKTKDDGIKDICSSCEKYGVQDNS